jgi:hypothetical protein
VLEIRPTERKAEVRDGGEEREGEREREREMRLMISFEHLTLEILNYFSIMSQ